MKKEGIFSSHVPPFLFLFLFPFPFSPPHPKSIHPSKKNFLDLCSRARYPSTPYIPLCSPHPQPTSLTTQPDQPDLPDQPDQPDQFNQSHQSRNKGTSANHDNDKISLTNFEIIPFFPQYSRFKLKCLSLFSDQQPGILVKKRKEVKDKQARQASKQKRPGTIFSFFISPLSLSFSLSLFLYIRLELGTPRSFF